MRSIIFKTKDMAQNLLELSLQGSQDYSNFNTCDDYVNSARTARNKFAPARQNLDSRCTSTGADELYLNQSKLSGMAAPPLTARDKSRE